MAVAARKSRRSSKGQRWAISHLADDQKPLTTLCGLPWESWQEPDIPTDDEIGLDSLPYAVRVAVREADARRALKPNEAVRRCEACFKWAMRYEPPIDGSALR